MKHQNKKYIFYLSKSQKITPNIVRLNKEYSFKIWKPSNYRITPKGLFSSLFFKLWILFFFNVFDYSVFIIYKDKEIAHYSIVSTKYFKFPFMNSNDFHIGPIMTKEEYRGQGLATFVLQKIIEIYNKNNCRFWYVVQEENKISRHLAEKFNFIPFGEGECFPKKFLGIKLFKKFIIKKEY